MEGAEEGPEVLSIPEVLKKPRISLTVILVIAIIGVACVGVLIWWYYQKVTPINSREYKTYSAYGLTFEYPSNMTINERGMLEKTASGNSGIILGELNNSKDELITIGWISSSSPPTDLGAALTGGLQGMEDEGVVVNEGQRVNSTKTGHVIIYQYFAAIVKEKTLYGIFGVWYCDVNDRFYELMVMYSEQDVLQIFEQYLGSFICH